MRQRQADWPRRRLFCLFFELRQGEISNTSKEYEIYFAGCIDKAARDEYNKMEIMGEFTLLPQRRLIHGGCRVDETKM